MTSASANAVRIRVATTVADASSVADTVRIGPVAAVQISSLASPVAAATVVVCFGICEQAIKYSPNPAPPPPFFSVKTYCLLNRRQTLLSD